MKKRLILLLISILLSLPLWWGANFSEVCLEDFFVERMGVKDFNILTAQANQRLILDKIKSLPKVENLEIGAKAAISAEIDKKGKVRVLFSKNPSQKLAIASLTKLMTALAVFDLKGSYDLSKEIRISKKAVNQEGVSKYSDLKEGKYLTVNSLLHVMLMESSNDAAYALTGPVGKEGFTDLMNLYAKDLGLENTSFVNPTGLEPDDPLKPINLSTTEDLVSLTEYVLENYPRIFEITNMISYEVLTPEGISHHFIEKNTNRLLAEFPQIIGGKTGWTPKAQGCLLIILKKPESEKYFINIVLGSKDRFTDMRKIIKEVNKISID